MKIDKGRISGTRFMFTVACFLQSSALLTSLLAGITRNDSWLAIVFGIMVSLPLIWVYRTLMVMFPDKNLIQVLDEVYGSTVGKIIGITYAWFFITLTSLNLSDLGDFAKITVMTETPHMVLTLMCILVSAWAVRYGIRIVTRYSGVFTIIEFVIVGVSILLMLNQINLKNLLPVFDLPAVKYIQGTHVITTIPFGELVIFLMITPNLKLSRREITKYWYLGFGMGTIILLIVLLRDITILGNTIHMFTLPGLVTLRLVNLGESLSRMEILFAIALIMLLFFKVTLLCYVSVITVAQLTKTKSYRHLALIIGILIVVYGFMLYSDSLAHSTTGQQTLPFVWMMFEIVIPLLTLIIAKARKLPKASEMREV
jgi:spore germination protein KB